MNTKDALLKLATDWPAARLVEIWNSLPGVIAVSKFKDRGTAVSRIWKALQSPGEGAPEQKAEESQNDDSNHIPEPERPAEVTSADTDTDVAPQGAHVAPEDGPAENEATPAPEAPVAPTG